MKIHAEYENISAVCLTIIEKIFNGVKISVWEWEMTKEALDYYGVYYDEIPFYDVPNDYLDKNLIFCSSEKVNNIMKIVDYYGLPYIRFKSIFAGGTLSTSLHGSTLHQPLTCKWLSFGELDSMLYCSNLNCGTPSCIQTTEKLFSYELSGFSDETGRRVNLSIPRSEGGKVCISPYSFYEKNRRFISFQRNALHTPLSESEEYLLYSSSYGECHFSLGLCASPSGSETERNSQIQNLFSMKTSEYSSPIIYGKLSSSIKCRSGNVFGYSIDEGGRRFLTGKDLPTLRTALEETNFVEEASVYSELVDGSFVSIADTFDGINQTEANLRVSSVTGLIKMF